MSITPVSPIVEMLIGGVWTDITDDVRLNSADSGGGIRIKRGVPNEGTVTEPTEVNFVLNNAGGKYSPKNELSVNYGLLGRNTPVRFGLLRRTETFGTAYTDTWGRLPSWTDRENKTVLGDKWRLMFSSANRFDVAGGVGTITQAAGSAYAMFGTFGDCEILVKVKSSVRDSEFGIVCRMADPAIDEQDWENGLGSWGPTGGSSTLALSTTQVHTGTTSALLTVAGSPVTAGARGAMKAVIPQRSYKARTWVRCSTARTVNGVITWKDEAGADLSTSSTGVAVAANTWTLIETDATCPDDAYYASFGPDMGSSPANGTLLHIDDLELMLNHFNGFTAYVTPGGTDSIRFGRLYPGGSTAVFQNLSTNFVAGDWWWMKAQFTGIRRAVKWWKDGTTEPADWTFVNADTQANDGRAQQPRAGMVGVFAKDGTSVVSFDSIQVTVWRAHAEVTQLPPRWDLSRQDQWVPISAKGLTRRLGQGRKALESPAKLFFTSYASTATAYAPLESFENAGNYVPNVVAGSTSQRSRNLQLGTPDQTGTLAMPGIAGFAEFNAADSYLRIRAKTGATPHTWSYFHFIRLPANPASDVVLYTVSATGTGWTWRVTLKTTGVVQVDALDYFGTVVGTNGALVYPIGTDIPIGSWMAMNLYVFSSAGTVTWALNFFRPGTTTIYTINGTFSGSAGVCLGADYQSSSAHVTAGNLNVAHALVYPGDLAFNTAAFLSAAYAYIGEEAITRYLRLGANAGIPVRTIGSTTDSKEMGAQGLSKTLDLMEETAEVDGGFLLEERGENALNIRSRVSLYNQIPIELDIDLGHLTEPLEPTDDDQATRNSVTVRRPNGGSATSIQTSGPLNVNDPEDDPDGVGLYESAPELNYHTDGQLLPAANWRRSVGTQDVVRYPSMTANLNSECYDDDPILTAEVLALDTGDVIKLTNREVSREPSLQMVQGYDEFFDQYDYMLTFNTKPAEIYTVGIVGFNTRLAGRWQSLAADYNAGTDVEISSATVAGHNLWVQVQDCPKAFPFDVMVAGVRARVTDVGRVINANPHMRNDISGWFASTGAMTYIRAVYTGDFFRPVGRMYNDTGGTAFLGSQSYGDVIAGKQYRGSSWLRVDDTTAQCGVDIYWLDSSYAYISNIGAASAAQTAADGWVHHTTIGTAPVGAEHCFITPYAEMANTKAMFWVDARVIQVDTANVSPQVLTIEQPTVNGADKLVASGTAITVADPWRLAF